MDYRVAELHKLLDDTSLDLRRDPEVRKYLDGRAALKVGDLSDDERSNLRRFGHGVARVTSERLGRDMAQDGEIGTDLERLPEERGDALYRFGSGYSRMAVLDNSLVTSVANSITISSQVPAVAEALNR
jgi:hypothetical protein